MTEYLFAYGTLLPGNEPSEIANNVARLKRIGSGAVRGRLYNFGAYPGIVLDNSSDVLIRGDVFALPENDPLLSELDSYEEYDPKDETGSLFIMEEGSGKAVRWAQAGVLGIRVQPGSGRSPDFSGEGFAV